MGPETGPSLIEAARGGDSRAESDLLRVLQQFARHVCRGSPAMGPTEPEWEDVAQEAARRLLKGAFAAYRPGGPERSYLYSIVKAARLQLRRTLVRRAKRETVSELTPAGSADPERSTLLGQLLARLAPGCRELLERSFFDGASTADLAAAFGLEESSVRSKLTRCLQRARALASDHAVSLAWVVLCLLGGPLVFAPLARGGSSLGPEADSVFVAVEELRLAGRYVDALALAREVRTRVQSPRRSDAICADRWRQTHAEVTVATLEHVLALPPETQRELASADSAFLLVEEAMETGDASRAMPALERQIEVRRRIHGDRHPDLAFAINDLALVYQAAEHYAPAESLFAAALSIREKAFGRDHPAVGEAYENLGYLLVEARRSAEAEPFLRAAVEILTACLGPDAPLVGRAIGKLGTALRAGGGLEESLQCTLRALAIRRREVGSLDDQVLAYTGQAGIALRGMGRYSEAEPYLREAVALSRELEGSESANTAVALNNLGALQNSQGDGAAAEILLRESLAIQEKLRGVDHASSSSTLNQLGMALRLQARLEEAELFYRRGLEVRRKSVGAEHRDVALSLNSIGTLLYARKQWEESEKVHRESLALHRKVLGAEHHEVALALHNLADVRARRGASAEAESLYEESLAMRRRTLGTRHPIVLRSLVSLAQLHFRAGHLESAESLLVEGSSLFEEARLRAGNGSARATSFSSPYPLLAATLLARQDPNGAWEAVERNLGRSLFDVLAASDGRRLIPADAAREEELRRRLAHWESRLPVARAEGDEAKAEAERELARVQADWSGWQQEASERYPLTEGQAYDLARVQASLQSDEAIAGWIEVPLPSGAGDGSAAWGYVVRNRGSVVFAAVPLADPRAPDSLASELRHALVDAGESLLGAPLSASMDESRALYRERFAPLEPSLQGVARLIVLPAGPLLGVPLAALEDDSGRLLSDRFEISYAPSATVWAWLRATRRARHKSPDASSPALLVGDPLLGQEAPDVLASAGSVASIHTSTSPSDPPSAGTPAPPAGFVSMAAWNRSALDGDRAALASLPSLPWSRREIESLHAILPNSRVLSGTGASEGALGKLAGDDDLRDFRILHFASHALVDDRLPERSAIVLSTPPSSSTSFPAADMPVSDGLLSAREILRDWELEADLVTLSACRTGLGRAVGGEGYLGLAHAFLQRGARCLLVSLWDVRDEATARLMERFYAHWLRPDGSRPSKAEALRAAQRDLREERDSDGRTRFAHPYYWAAFVLVGDPS